jgi:hypothetical protein
MIGPQDAGRGRISRGEVKVSRVLRSKKNWTRVRFDRTIHVPEDEICFFVFDAPSGREAALAAQPAELDPIRVVQTIPSREEN